MPRQGACGKPSGTGSRWTVWKKLTLRLPCEIAQYRGGVGVESSLTDWRKYEYQRGDQENAWYSLGTTKGGGELGRPGVSVNSTNR